MPIDSVTSHAPSAQFQPHDASHATPGTKQDLLEQMLDKLDRLLETMMRQLRSSSGEHARSHHHGHHAHGHTTDRQVTQDAPTTGGGNATSVDQAAPTVHPTFLPVLRGDEQQKDAQIKNEADFGRAVDETAKEYGLNPNVFRAQLQVESGAFSQGYQKAMHFEGDLDRASNNNTSIGLGQISRKFLDGRDWSQDGPGNKRVGSQVVTTAQYENSVTVQLRMAASNLAQRIADHGSLKQGRSYYVSGNDNPNNPIAANYIQKIDAALKDPAVLTPGR